MWLWLRWGQRGLKSVGRGRALLPMGGRGCCVAFFQLGVGWGDSSAGMGDSSARLGWPFPGDRSVSGQHKPQSEPAGESSGGGGRKQPRLPREAAVAELGLGSAAGGERSAPADKTRVATAAERRGGGPPAGGAGADCAGGGGGWGGSSGGASAVGGEGRGPPG